MKISHTFGTFIKEKRQQRDISLRKFADQIGIHGSDLLFGEIALARPGREFYSKIIA